MVNRIQYFIETKATGRSIQTYYNKKYKSVG